MINKLISPIKDLSRTGQLCGILLILATICSLFLSNSSIGLHYIAIWKMPLIIGPIHLSLSEWINEGLMTAFFLLVGLEIKREIVTGQLSRIKQASLPMIAAIGGVIIPACIFLIFNHHSTTASGWAIPTATDIAFSLGMLSLIGKKIPFSLRIFLTALAIIDDLIAIGIITCFYSGNIHLLYISMAIILTGLLFSINRFDCQNQWIYISLGFLLWLVMLKSGIHPTIAGVILAMTIPINKITQIEHTLNKPVNYAILPLFTLCNMAITLPIHTNQFISKISIGIILGLCLGKIVGISLFSWLGVRLKLSEFPSNIHWRQFTGVGLFAGIGFTMSIFVTNLSFINELQITQSKFAILLGSMISALLATAIIKYDNKKTISHESTAKHHTPPKTKLEHSQV